MYKISNFETFVPYGAQYVDVISETNGVYSVRYYGDPQKRNPILPRYVTASVLSPETLRNLVEFEEDHGIVLSVIRVETDKRGNPKMRSDGSHIHIGEEFRYVDAGGHERGVLSAGVRPGDVIQIPAQGNVPGILMWVEIVDIEQGEELLAMESSHQEPKKTLKDTTKVQGQNQHKPRKAKNSKGDKYKDGKVKDNDIYDYGDDIRGLRRYPHSTGEEGFDDQHDIQNVIDHPANTNDWMKVVTNKDVGHKFEDVAPLSSSSLLKEERTKSIASMDDDIVDILEQFYNEIKAKVRNQEHVSEYRFSRKFKTDSVTYSVPRFANDGIALRRWFIEDNERILRDTSVGDNRDIAEILKYVRANGFQKNQDVPNIQQFIGTAQGVAKDAFKIYTHEFMDKGNPDDVVLVEFKLRTGSSGLENMGATNYLCDITLVTKEMFDRAGNPDTLEPR